MYYFFYEDTAFESEVYATYEEAEKAWNEVSAEVASRYGSCDPDRLFITGVVADVSLLL